MARTTLIARALVALPLVASPVVSSGISWAPTHEDAMRDARAQGKVVLVAVNMDDEASSDRMAKAVYRDKRVIALTSKTINLLASTDEHSQGSCKRFRRTCS